jgi:hypothetical protein
MLAEGAPHGAPLHVSGPGGARFRNGRTGRPAAARVGVVEGAPRSLAPAVPLAGEPPPDAVAPNAIIRASAPRLVRDGFGPLATFFAGWKLIGLTAGIVLALAFGLAVYAHERRQGRPAALVRISLAVVCLRAIVGLSSGSATVYLAQEIAIDLVLATTVLGTLAAGRPLTAWVAADVYPFTEEMRRSHSFAAVMRRITLVWGCYFLVVALSDVPFLIALLAWSVHHTVATFRRDPRWQAWLAQAEAAQGGAADV